uniref:TY3B-TY3B protein n=1 Tax=Mycena chlorophos TaxID=658473 RepID=A0ABQ0KUP6_MYCCL|nr:TY3B-TY3B protein [Mycena chlorophos]
MYAASPLKREVIDKQMDLWFARDVIEPSSSPWAAPCVVVFRNGKARLAVDYRRLNAETIADKFPIPRQYEIVQALSGAQVLSSFDALAGFNQVAMDQESRKKTAFRSHRGLWQFKRMPFGLRNGPAIFQRIMQSILSPITKSVASIQCIG